MKQLFILTFLLLTAATTQTANALPTENDVDLDELYKQIDKAIENSPRYVAEFEKRLAKQKDLYLNEKDPNNKLVSGMLLFDMYRSFKNDSALHYLQQCIDLADRLQRKDMAGLARVKMARQCSNSGLYTESRQLLDEVDASALTNEGLTDYYEARMHLYGEIAYYSLLPAVKDEYNGLRHQYRDSLVAVANKGSEAYLLLRVSELTWEQKLDEALAVSDDWINRVAEGTREDAMASYFRFIVYDQMKNTTMMKYWLGKSALADIKCAVMDQAALIGLADLVNKDGDMERSYKYIRFTWDCNNYFNTRMRSSQISPVLGVIEKNYQSSIDRNTLILTIATIIFIVLTLALVSVLVYVYRQRNLLAKARHDLTVANEELSKSNASLKWMNDQVTKSNKHLFELNEELRKGN